MGFEKVLKDIESVRIQGAENIAKEAANSLLFILNKSYAKTPVGLYHELMGARHRLTKARPAEPCMRNALNYVFHNVYGKDLKSLVSQVKDNIDYVSQHFHVADEVIAQIGSKLVKSGSVIYTHCHSSSVVGVLAKARLQGRHFEVHNTETRPLFQGRKTSKELASLGITVKHYTDSAMRLAIKKADVCLLGADAIQSNCRVINKIGSELVSETAERFDVPVFICTSAWKFDPKTIFSVDEPIENRKRDEVWSKAPKNVRIMNPAFEKIDPKYITSIISEMGAFSPNVFVTEVRRQFPWIWH